MLIIRIVTIALWIIAGILVLKREKISKFDYGIVWISLLISLIGRLFG